MYDVGEREFFYLSFKNFPVLFRLGFVETVSFLVLASPLFEALLGMNFGISGDF
jgi:hypothetical protein